MFGKPLIRALLKLELEENPVNNEVVSYLPFK